MCKLKPLLQKWLEDADSSVAKSGGGVFNINTMTSTLSSTPESILGRRRKKRTSIETTVRTTLEKAFLMNCKPTSEEITQLSERLNMDKEVIRVWFWGVIKTAAHMQFICKVPTPALEIYFEKCSNPVNRV